MPPAARRPATAPSPLTRLRAGLAVRYAMGFRHAMPAGDCCAVHQHAELEVVYHASGSGVTGLGADHAPLRFAAGSVVLYPPRWPHDQRMETAGVDACVLLAWRGRATPWPPAPLLIPALHSPYAIAELNALSQPPEFSDAASRAVFDCRAQALLAALVVEVASTAPAARSPEAPGGEYVRAAQRYVSEHLAQVAHLADVAAAVGVSAEYLRHLFVQHTGTSLTRWLAELRIHRATELLLRSPLPLKAIAAVCGYRDECYFSTAFKQHTGLTPGQCRRRGAGPPPRTVARRGRALAPPREQ